jgi:hypothetical protein
MANQHYAEIGDVWKHLPLAEVLAIERPDRYWETHAGSALYPLTPSPTRDYGAYRVLARAGKAQTIDQSTYLHVLRQHGSGGQGGHYPGSARIAVSVLGQTVREYRLADLDPHSVDGLRASVAELAGRDRVTAVEGDGIAAILKALATLEPAAARSTFALLDPYRPLEPTAAGVSPADLWARLSGRGVRTMLWYGFATTGDHSEVTAGIRAALDREGVDPRQARVWAGEITVAGFGAQPLPWDPGVPGCGIACANLSHQATAVCEALGNALQTIYAGTRLPTGDDGSLSFRSLTYG